MRLTSSEFATTPPDADTISKYIWSITPDGSAESIQETSSNPYQPTGLLLNTWHTVTVTHRGTTLGDSTASASSRFKTGASRNLADHYDAKVAEIEARFEARLAALEAKGSRRKKAD